MCIVQNKFQQTNKNINHINDLSHQVWGFFTFSEDLAYCGTWRQPCYQISRWINFLFKIQNFLAMQQDLSWFRNFFQIITKYVEGDSQTLRLG